MGDFMKISAQAITLATLGVVGFSGPGKAAIVTVTENFTPSIYTGSEFDIAVDSATPQFFYSGVKTVIPLTGSYVFGTLSGGEIATTGIQGTASIDPSLTYQSNPSGLDVANVKGANATLTGTGYVNLAFTNDDGVMEYGYATFDPNTAEITSITYATPAVPEASTWAMLIAGGGALGLVAHRRRRTKVETSLVRL
jgi:PEP-CTERM motif